VANRCDRHTVTSSIWLPISNIIICGNRLINEDDNEAVRASHSVVDGTKVSAAEEVVPLHAPDIRVDGEHAVTDTNHGACMENRAQ
jgi:hypothetical protein